MSNLPSLSPIQPYENLLSMGFPQNEALHAVVTFRAISVEQSVALIFSKRETGELLSPIGMEKLYILESSSKQNDVSPNSPMPSIRLSNKPPPTSSKPSLNQPSTSSNPLPISASNISAISTLAYKEALSDAQKQKQLIKEGQLGRFLLKWKTHVFGLLSC